jgi:DNA-binding HxlR family transcriptional regulator
LRDLHAGPARFSDLQGGLRGIASNMLSSRLEELQAQGLIRKRDAGLGVTVYELTPLGLQTDQVLFALGEFGARFPPNKENRRPENMRATAVMLKVACQRVATPAQNLLAVLMVDKEPVSLIVRDGRVDVRYGDSDEPQVTLHTTYAALAAVADRRMSPNEFAARHARAVGADPSAAADLLALLARAMA